MSNLVQSVGTAHDALSSAASYQVSTWANNVTNVVTGTAQHTADFVNGIATNYSNSIGQFIADWNVWADALHTAFTAF